MSFQRKLVNLVNVASGASATLRIPIGPTYDRLMLRLIGNGGAGATLANLQNVRLLLNGKVIEEYSDLTVLNTINQIYGRGAAANGGAAGAVGVDTSVCLHFRRPEVQQMTLPDGKTTLYGIDAERVTSLRTGNLGVATLEFTIAAGYVSPQIEAYSDEQPDVSENIGLIKKFRKFVYNAGASGDFDTLYDIPRGPRILAVHYNFTAGIIQRVTMKANSVALLDTLTTNAGPLGVGGAANSFGALEDFQRFSQQNPIAPQSGFDSLIFVSDGNLDEAVRTANLRDLRATLTLSAAGAMNTFVEYLDTFDGL